MKPIRLLCAISSLNGGGAERVMLHLCRRLPAHGFDVTLLLGRRSGQFAAQIPNDVETLVIGSERGYVALPKMRELLGAGRFDVAFSMTSFNMTSSLARVLTPRADTKLAFGVRNHYTSALTREASLPTVRKLLVRALYPQADIVIAVAEDARRDLITRFGLKPERIVTIHNPVDLAAVRAQASAPCPDPWLEGDVPVFVNVGKLMEAKGQIVLLEAFRRVLERVDARLLILGVGPLEDELQRAARDKGIVDRVRFTGFQTNPYAFMGRASAFVLSSLWEGFPNVLVEAMAAGAAVISTDCPSGPSEIVRDGESGLLVPPADAERLAAAMIQVAEQPSLREYLRRGASAAVEAFAIEGVVARYAETFQRLVS